jgi:hypothetical protein
MPEEIEQEGESETPETARASFETLYAPLAKEVFHALVREALAEGSDPGERACQYAELGKPDFALAYLLACGMPDDEKRSTLAHAYDRRAETTEVRAREFDGKFHRPFPLLFAEAANDRATARTIRAGRPVRPVRPRESRSLPLHEA